MDQIHGTACTGRAGRDGEPARCVLFYRFSDVLRQAALMCMEVRLLTAPCHQTMPFVSPS
jgi:superfamily II DNA helicase RecQ